MEYKQKVQLINNLMIKTNVTGDLQHRIRSYLEYIWQEEKEMDDKEVNNIVEKLSKTLQEELQYEIRGNVLRKCKAFEKFSVNLLKDCTQIMEDVRFSPEEEIFSENYQDDHAIYVITKGKIDICYQTFDLIGNKVIEKNY